MSYFSKTVDSINLVIRGLVVLWRKVLEVLQALSAAALIFQGWFTPFYFRDRLHWSIVLAGYFAAGVITVLILTVFVGHLKRMGEAQQVLANVNVPKALRPGVLNRATE